MKIVVLAGGTSTERDVSFSSGRGVYEALKRKGHQVILLDLFMGYEAAAEEIPTLFEQDIDWAANIGAISDQAPDIEQVKALRKDQSDSEIGENVISICQQADIVFLALHGQNGEDGKVQAAFDLLDIKYTGTGYKSSTLAIDKSISKTLFKQNSIPTPHDITEQCMDLGTSPAYPCVIKVCCGGSSVGVYIVHNDEEYQLAMRDAVRYEGKILVEQYIRGREFSIGVVDGKALPIIEIAPIVGFYDYKNKYQAGSAVETCPAKLDQVVSSAMMRVAERVIRVLGIETYARVDFMMDENQNFYCLEANTLPGMTPTSLLPQEAAAIGTDYDDLCEWIIQISLAKYKENNN
ncbi:MAG: D-alanine--D-alanine ligase [Clostridia bacterium]|nr:D-alanine--D-alanine ligase [Clostridia bacterium]